MIELNTRHGLPETASADRTLYDDPHPRTDWASQSLRSREEHLVKIAFWTGRRRNPVR